MRLLSPVRAAAVATVALALAACGSSGGAGWTYAPASDPPPVASPDGSPAPSPGATPSVAPASPGGSPDGESPGASPGGDTLTVTARGIEFVEKELQAPADTPFQIAFVNEDQAPHDVDIRDSGGATISDNEVLNTAGEITYDIEPLPAGEYTFICSIHPIPAMTGTLTVQ